MASFRSVEGMEVVAAADDNRLALESFTKDFALRGYSAWRAMLETERLDLAAIFLPHSECPKAAVACAERGIHVLVEKPMAASPDGVREMIDAARQAGVVLSTPYVWRYHPVARQMKQFVDNGTLGSVISCEGRCAAGRLHRYIDGRAGWMLRKAMSGGGPMYNLGVHWIDLYRWLLADEVVEVVGRNVKVNQEYDIEDNSFALVTFSRGTVLALDISYTVPDSYPNGRDLHLSVRGTSGVLSWSPAYEGIAERLFVCSDAPGFAAAPRRRMDFELDSKPGYAGVLGFEYLRDLADSIRAKLPPPITGEDGLRALEVVEAIYHSAETGRVVPLPPAR
jgi:predicted dehydrogenase